jgi:hypothetical protein
VLFCVHVLAFAAVIKSLCGVNERITMKIIRTERGSRLTEGVECCMVSSFIIHT